MATKNFSIKNGLSIQNEEVIDSNRNIRVNNIIMTGSASGLSITENQISDLKDYTVNQTVISDTASGSLNIPSNSTFILTPSASAELNIIDVPTSGSSSVTFHIINGGTNITWPTNTKWAGGNIPTLTVSGRDIFRLTTIDAGTTWYGEIIALDIK